MTQERVAHINPTVIPDCRFLLEHLPELMRTKREHRGDSLREAAPKVGIGFGHLNDFEHRKHQPKLDTILSMLNYLEDRD